MQTESTSIVPDDTDVFQEIIPASTPPSGVNENAIREPDPETVKAIQQMNQEEPGLSFGIYGTYAEQVLGTYDAFYVEKSKPFIGRFDLWNGLPQAHTFAIACILDHWQTPCTPGAPLIQMMVLNADQRIQLPLEISNLTNGLHDFSVMFWQDPFADHNDPQADSRVFDSESRRARVSLFVDGDTTPPTFSLEQLSSGWPAHDYTWLFVHQKMDPRDKFGGFVIQTHLTVSAGELFNLYLHLNNRQAQEINWVVTAFIDYQQIAIYHDGQAHKPLYVRTPPSSWQPIAVQIRAPDRPGSYEFIVVGTLLPFVRLDADVEKNYGIEYTLVNNAFSSARILLEVE